MAVCMECGLNHNPEIQPPQNGLLGWIGICQLCEKVTKVYPNTHFGVNPKVAAEPRFSGSVHEK